MKTIMTGIAMLFFILMMMPFAIHTSRAARATIIIPDDFPTIQQGIDAAMSGDTVMVRNGTFLLTASLDFKGKAITVKSENGAGNCILDGKSTQSVVYFHSGEGKNSVLSGFTIRNGKAQKGGGICLESSSPTITECIISSNLAYKITGAYQDPDAYGGGIYCSGSSPDILNCKISGNQVQVLQDSSYTPGYGARGGRSYGAGIYINGGSPVITGCLIDGNTTAISNPNNTRGGTYAWGGGIYSTASSPSLNNTIISNNSVVVSNDSQGGGVYFASGSPTMINCIIRSNSAKEGGGIYFNQSSAFSNLTNCTIVRNTATTNGGGLFLASTSPKITNSILWEDSPQEVHKDSTASNPTITYSDVYGGYTGTGNVNANPLFVDTAQQDYHLKVGSPCIDTGNNSAPYLPTADLEGKLRIWNGIVDMGVYEYQACSLPGKAVPVSPSGSVATITPTYSWNAVPSATWYYLWVNDVDGNKVKQWYTAAQAGCSSGTGICSITPATALRPGEAHFWVQTYNSCGYGAWSDDRGFNVTVGGLPGKATLLSPSGSISTATPTYIWNAVSGATWYYLWVKDNSAATSKIAAWNTASQAGCGSGTGTCSISPSTALVAGPAIWWIATWNESGWGPWSDGMSFTVAVEGPPGKAILVSPSGLVSTTTPTYTWNAVGGATWYRLWVKDNSQFVNRIDTWYTAAQANCGSGIGICSITPIVPLVSGTAQWWIQTWNPSGYGPWSDPMSFTVP